MVPAARADHGASPANGRSPFAHAPTDPALQWLRKSFTQTAPEYLAAH